MRSYLRKVAPASLSLDSAPCKLEGAGKVREESGETWLGFHLTCICCALPLATSGQEKESPWVSSGAWSSLNLVFSLKRVRECFPLTSLQAAISGLAIAPALVYSLGKKTSSLLIPGEGGEEGERGERGDID